jgi:hypothetical protein
VKVSPRNICAALFHYGQGNYGSVVDDEITIKDDPDEKFKWIGSEISDGPELL